MKRLLPALLVIASVLLVSCEKDMGSTCNPSVWPYMFAKLMDAAEKGVYYDSALKCDDYVAFSLSDGQDICLPYSDVKVIDCNLFDIPSLAVDSETGRWTVNLVQTDVYDDRGKATRKSYPVCVYYNASAIFLAMSNGEIVTISNRPETCLRSFQILAKDNPRISKDIEFKGSLHMAWPGHSWGPALVNRVYDRTDSSVVADRSPGILEVEIENVSEQSGLDSAKVLAHAPEIILSHSNELTEHGLAIERAEAAIDYVSDDALERITHINTVLNGIIGTLSTVNTALLRSVDNEQLLLKNTVLTQQIMANQLGLSNPEFLPKSPEKGTFSPHLEGYQ